jgi:nitrate reductase NapE component
LLLETAVMVRLQALTLSVAVLMFVIYPAVAVVVVG